MNLSNITPGQRIAAEIERIAVETTKHVELQLSRIHQLVNTPGQQANILEAFGTNALAAFQSYEAFRQAMLIAAPDRAIPAPDMMVFQPQADGSVIYAPPTEP